MDQNTCNDPNYIARIAFNVAKIFRDPGSKITVRPEGVNVCYDDTWPLSTQCCTTDGCNWSLDSAANNLGLSQLNSSDSSDSTVYYGYLGIKNRAVTTLITLLPHNITQGSPWASSLSFFSVSSAALSTTGAKMLRMRSTRRRKTLGRFRISSMVTTTTITTTITTTDREVSAASGRATGIRLNLWDAVRLLWAEDLKSRNISFLTSKPSPPSFRISVREATPPEDEAELYNYNFKDKWDLSLAQAGMSSSLEPPAEDNYRGKKKSVSKAPSRTSYSSQDDSAWGWLDIFFEIYLIWELGSLQEVSTTELTRTTSTSGGETAERTLRKMTTRLGLLSYRETTNDIK